jgi:glycerophosphoryl diester phosphodiesterase
MTTHHPLSIYHRVNTPTELEKAISMPVDGIETDLRMTRDGVVIIHHDRRVENDSHRFYWIDKLNYKELVEMTGSIFTFEEFLELFTKKVPRSKLPSFLLDLDLKQPGMEKKISGLLTKYSITNVLMCSPDIWVLKSIEEEFPKGLIGLTYYPEDRWDLATNRAFRYFSVLAQYSLKPFLFRLIRRKTKKSDIEVASIHHKLVNTKVVSFLHQYDVKIFTWGTDREKRLQELVELGVDGIKTKSPELLKKILSS